MVRFVHPWVLLLIPALAGLALWRIRVQWGRFALRAASMILLILALAGLEVALRRPPQQALLLVDRSASVSRTTSTGELRDVLLELVNASPDHTVGVIEFGQRAEVTTPLGGEFTGLSTTPRLDHGTDLLGAVELALGVLPADGANQLVLISDGRVNRGLTEAIGKAQLASVPVFVRPVGEEAVDARVLSLHVPPNVGLGEPYVIDVEIESESGGAATLALYRNDDLLVTQDVILENGRSRFALNDRLSAAGTYEYRFVVKRPGDEIAENDALSALVQTTTRPSLLWVDPEGRALVRDLLPALALDFTYAETLPPLEVLSQYRLAILSNIALDALTARQSTDLKQFVRNLGGGLFFVLGAEEVRGFAPSPVEEILPISYAVPEREIVPSLAIVYLLDRSSSMRALSGSVAKIRMLRNAAAASITLLPENTIVGVVAFDDTHQWIIPMGPVGDGSTVYGSLQAIRADGGTELYAPLEDALRRLANVEARSKHLILISDGRTSNEDRDFPGLMDQLREAEDISLSAIALGESPNFALLEPLVEAGEGGLYHVTNPLKLPQLTMQVTQRLSRSRFVEGSIPVTGSLIEEAGLAGAPSVSGYVLTFPRASARAGLLVGQDPLFSSWQIGLGVVSVLNTDLNGAWTSEWAGWPELSLLFAELIEETRPSPRSASGLIPSLEIDGETARLTIDAREATGDLAHFLSLRATLLPLGDSFDVPQVAPGLYSASFPSPEAGGYALQLEEAGGRGTVLPVTVPYATEFESSGVDEKTLARVADLTGGAVLESGTSLLRVASTGRSQYRSIHRELLLGALGLFLLDLLLRKVPGRRRRRTPRAETG